jgi:hypothetical protein
MRFAAAHPTFQPVGPTTRRLAVGGARSAAAPLLSALQGVPHLQFGRARRDRRPGRGLPGDLVAAVDFARQYAPPRRAPPKRERSYHSTSSSKSGVSVTGSNADLRLAVAAVGPGAGGSGAAGGGRAAARKPGAALAGGSAVRWGCARMRYDIEARRRPVVKHRGASLVVSGSEIRRRRSCRRAQRPARQRRHDGGHRAAVTCSTRPMTAPCPR